MRVSQYYKLGLTQPSLSFVDVDVYGDARLFVSPRALRLLEDKWGDECVYLVQNFFTTVLEHIRAGRTQHAIALMAVLREPNETHLGLSKGNARGRGLGSKHAEDLWYALSQSKAAKTGLMKDLEDTVLLVPGVDVDIVSDITTNIIRRPLIDFTQQVCREYEIPLEAQVDSGPLWNPIQKAWETEFVQLPVPDGGKLLLVPKVIVRINLEYDVQKYFRHYILEHLKGVEEAAHTALVRTIKKTGEKRVFKTDLVKKYGEGKRAAIEQTLAHPEVLQKYRSDHKEPTPPLSHIQIAEISGSEPPDWDALLSATTSLPTGNESADQYEKAVAGLLSALFYPSLSNPKRQMEIHEGRKRIDITYTNTATRGFFHWLGQHYSAAHVFVECKNYGAELANPELDQISGRFSPSRGLFGILVCREFKNKGLFTKRCKDTAVDDRGFVVSLDDNDLAALVKERKKTPEPFLEYPLLQRKFEALVM
jgi:hypothetical protein